MSKSFLTCLKSKIVELDECDDVIVFTISSTADKRTNPYFTPVRRSNGYCVFGCVLYDETIVTKIIEIIDGKVDWIAVDAEKKLSIELLVKKEISDERRKTNEVISTGNLSRLVTNIAKTTKVLEYKANDITVDATWALCSDHFGCLSGLKAAIIGAGNVGSKLALKLVESGVNISIYRRNTYKAYEITNALNLIKPDATMSTVQVASSPISCAFSADMVIGSNSGGPLITESELAAAKKNSLVVDIGKGSLDESAINYAKCKKITLHRLDAGYHLLSTIIADINYLQDFHAHRGEREWGGKRIVAGGCYGFEGDVVIDSISSPKNIFGYADGRGNIRKPKSEEEQIFLEKMGDKVNDKTLW